MDLSQGTTVLLVVPAATLLMCLATSILVIYGATFVQGQAIFVLMIYGVALAAVENTAGIAVQSASKMWLAMCINLAMGNHLSSDKLVARGAIWRRCARDRICFGLLYFGRTWALSHVPIGADSKFDANACCWSNRAANCLGSNDDCHIFEHRPLAGHPSNSTMPAHLLSVLDSCYSEKQTYRRIKKYVAAQTD